MLLGERELFVLCCHGKAFGEELPVAVISVEFKTVDFLGGAVCVGDGYFHIKPRVVCYRLTVGCLAFFGQTAALCPTAENVCVGGGAHNGNVLIEVFGRSLNLPKGDRRF